MGLRILGRQPLKTQHSIYPSTKTYKDLYFNIRIRTKNNRILSVFCGLWLQKKQSVKRNEQSSLTNTGRKFATKGEGNIQLDPPKNYI